ncbi:MAG: hypothetical protein FJ272_20470, partial [Planctomycetes bacterium]|nr:hypothetical protein [Planctomycetota bacterium]
MITWQGTMTMVRHLTCVAAFAWVNVLPAAGADMDPLFQSPFDGTVEATVFRWHDGKARVLTSLDRRANKETFTLRLDSAA